MAGQQQRGVVSRGGGSTGSSVAAATVTGRRQQGRRRQQGLADWPGRAKLALLSALSSRGRSAARGRGELDSTLSRKGLIILGLKLCLNLSLYLGKNMIANQLTYVLPTVVIASKARRKKTAMASSFPENASQPYVPAVWKINVRAIHVVQTPAARAHPAVTNASAMLGTKKSTGIVLILMNVTQATMLV
ncbi:uncharacterized protein LOC135215920 [Macrobrachium nipponense]|uniref:uncharacterized protein LOC135215920 n=1 Tax=Macrobrachium nipponense TaxID=159736 RepID=UPI0030C83708